MGYREDMPTIFQRLESPMTRLLRIPTTIDVSDSVCLKARTIEMFF